jgi:hypothetical protein
VGQRAQGQELRGRSPCGRDAGPAGRPEDSGERLAVTSNKLARFMRRHGFAAYPGTALGGLTDYPHLAELAGPGAIG